MTCSVNDSPQRRRLVEDVRQRLFTPGSGPPRIGAEVELIPLRADDGSPVPVRDDETGPGLLGFLRRYGDPLGWTARTGRHGGPELVTPDGGVISFEPGGQVELATRPRPSVDALVADLERIVPPLVDAAADEGVRLLGIGMDPVNRLERARLQLPGERYQTMHRYFAAIGEAGPRMMLQTAAIQVNVELGSPGASAALRWRVLNAVAPYLTAIFANSPAYAGEDTGFASYRARQWRLLDRRRTGLLGREDDRVGEYADFALSAGWVFGPGESEPFVDRLLRGAATLDDWRRHLSTLFPEIRPRGYLEIRGIDALPPRWYPAPLVLLAGLIADDRVLIRAGEIAGEPDSALLQDAARVGLGDPRIAGPASELFALALDAAERAGTGPTVVGAAREFFQRYTARSRAPADDDFVAAA